MAVKAKRIDALEFEHDGVTYRIYYMTQKDKGRTWFFTTFDSDEQRVKRFKINASIYQEFHRVPKKDRHLVGMQVANEMTPIKTWIKGQKPIRKRGSRGKRKN